MVVIGNNRLNSLDFLRGGAVIFVIISHLNYFLNDPVDLLYYGRFGVQLFFCISGYLFLVKFNINFSTEFLIKRVFRLFPLYISFILIFSLLNSNIEGIYFEFFLLNSLNPERPFPIVPGGWTISLEWLFTLTLFFFFRNKKLTYGIILFLYLINSISEYSCMLSNISPDYYYTNPLNQFLAFYLIYYYKEYKISMIFLLALITCYFFNLISINSILFFLIITLMIFTINLSLRINLKNKFMELIGKSSYGVYLVHFLILELFLKIPNIKDNYYLISLWIILSIVIGIIVDDLFMKLYHYLNIKMKSLKN